MLHETDEFQRLRAENEALRAKLAEWIKPCFCEGHAGKCMMCETRELFAQVSGSGGRSTTAQVLTLQQVADSLPLVEIHCPSQLALAAGQGYICGRVRRWEKQEVQVDEGLYERVCLGDHVKTRGVCAMVALKRNGWRTFGGGCYLEFRFYELIEV